MAARRIIPFIIGQTASGKKAVAHLLARRTGAEVVSVDSMKVYRGMDIGTAKPSRRMREEVPYHMVDVVGPEERIDVKWYLDRVNAVLAGPDVPLVFSGGSPLYVKAILSGLFDGPPRDPALREELHGRAEREGPERLHAELRAVDPLTASRVGSRDLKRIVRALEVYACTGRPFSSFLTQFRDERREVRFVMVGLRWERPLLYERIDRRVDEMFARGLPEEVISLHAAGRFGPTAGKAIGYREIIEAIEKGENPGSALVRERVKRNTRIFSRKQMTWFRGFGCVRWIRMEAARRVEDVVDEIVSLPDPGDTPGERG